MEKDLKSGFVHMTPKWREIDTSPLGGRADAHFQKKQISPKGESALCPGRDNDGLKENVMNKGKIFSFDAETNGLWGQAFALSAIVYEDGQETARFLAYLGADAVTDSYVKQNILPKLVDVPVTHDNLAAMLGDFASFYLANKKDAAVVVHMGTPVESTVLKQMHDFGLIGDWDGPYPLYDLVGYLAAAGEDPTSVDTYNAKFDLMKGRAEAEGLEAHHPLYDSVAAAVAYMHLTA